MQLDDMNLFIRLARTGSLSEAARQLGITAASVSARLKRIETETRSPPGRMDHALATPDASGRTIS